MQMIQMYNEDNSSVCSVHSTGNVCVCVSSHGVVSDAVVLGLSGQAVGRALPAAESLGLVVVDLHWPLPRRWQYIKHGPVAIVCVCVCVCV